MLLTLIGTGSPTSSAVTCAADSDSGGTIDQITDAQCLLANSKHRAVKLINAI